MEDLPIGAEVVLKVVETDKRDCLGCFFDEISSNLFENICNHIKCMSTERKDGKNIQFIRVK